MFGSDNQSSNPITSGVPPAGQFDNSAPPGLPQADTPDGPVNSLVAPPPPVVAPTAPQMADSPPGLPPLTALSQIGPSMPAQPLANPFHDSPTNGSLPPDLLNIKKQALESLTPLVGQLNQTPEEKFKTTMMLIQASDNPALIKDAYDAAQKITDEKVRAQALLDTVNEINYFNHKDQPAKDEPLKPADMNHAAADSSPA